MMNRPLCLGGRNEGIGLENSYDYIATTNNSPNTRIEPTNFKLQQHTEEVIFFLINATDEVN